MRDMTHSYVWHDSFICVTWLIHMCDMTHSCVWYDSFICEIWLIHMCDMSHSHERLDPRIWYPWNDWVIREWCIRNEQYTSAVIWFHWWITRWIWQTWNEWGIHGWLIQNEYDSSAVIWFHSWTIHWIRQTWNDRVILCHVAGECVGSVAVCCSVLQCVAVRVRSKVQWLSHSLSCRRWIGKESPCSRHTHTRTPRFDPPGMPHI